MSSLIENDKYTNLLKGDIKNVVDSSKEEGKIEESDKNISNGITKGYSNEMKSYQILQEEA